MFLKQRLQSGMACKDINLVWSQLLQYLTSPLIGSHGMKFKIKLESDSTANNLDVSLLAVHVKKAVVRQTVA
jgi:hypothetical protein